MKVQGSTQLAVVKAGERRCFESSSVSKKGAESKHDTQTWMNFGSSEHEGKRSFCQ